jgi:hypothetical protein
MQVPILTYHGNGINGTEYHNNDHVALEADLLLMHELGLKVITLSQLLDWRLGTLSDEAVNKSVVLTCDDGTWFDYYDVDHPFHGIQTSLFNILKNHQQKHHQSVHISNFVIVSPQARKILDEKCLIGKGWWTDEWWYDAQNSGLMSIENHSWDHNHGVLENNNVNDNTFKCINNRDACDKQFKQSQQFIHDYFKGQHHARFFAYPYGNFSDYLRHQYLPETGHDLGLQAALTTEPKHVTKQSDVWALPRYVCNNDWKSTEELAEILTA